MERQFFKLVSKRLSGFPLSYLTGHKEFYLIPFRVMPGVFIPRPETELIVDKVLELSSREHEMIVDLGTGCGNLAIALAKELPKTRIIATDISRKALKLARLNASLQYVSRIQFVQGSLFSSLKKYKIQKKCDFIVSNPPYVSESEWKRMSPEIRNHEPRKAVVAGKTGLEFIKEIVKNATRYLKSGAYLIFEIGEGQRDGVISLFNSGWLGVESHSDLFGIPRVVTAQKK